MQNWAASDFLKKKMGKKSSFIACLLIIHYIFTSLATNNKQK
jgi:hypothetical protein